MDRLVRSLRTTERQPDLVRASLDRLLRTSDFKPLVSSTDMSFARAADGATVTGPAIELTFDRPMSPSRMKDLLDREFKKASADDGDLTFELTGLDTPEDHRYKQMRLDVSKNSKFMALRRQAEANAETAALAAAAPARAEAEGGA